MFVPPVTDERSGLLAFLDEQRQAIRRSVHGLTEQQARLVPSASSLSLAALLSHVIRVEERWTVVALGGRTDPAIWPVADWDAEFRVGPEVLLAGLLDEWAAMAAQTEATVAEFADMGQLCRGAEAAEDGLTARWILLHLIEEFARHAGHADIIRETIDGASAHRLEVLQDESGA
jgi:uncharacterized damage-inducible protein DinB